MTGQTPDAFDAEWLTNQIAHALRNTLFGMMVHLELLQQRASGDPALERGLDSVWSQMKRLEATTEEMLVYGRPVQAHVAPVAVAALLDELAQAARAGSHGEPAEVTVNADPGIRVQADAQLLRSALGPLLDNAVQHTPAPHRIRLEAEAVGAEIVLQVQDHGTGIPADLADQVLLPFAPQHGGRLGLGLAIALKLIRAQHGRLELHSEAGSGTTVRLILPPAGD